MLSIQDAAVTAGVSYRTVQNWIKGGSLHLMETPGGRPFICRDSILRPALRLLGDGAFSAQR